MQYTLSKTYNNTSGITYFAGSSFDPAADWARSDNDRRHKFDLLASMRPTKWLGVGAALSLYSGKPVNVTTGSDDNHDGIVTDRPDGLPRNTFHGPGLINLDLNVSHDFMLSKKRKEARTLAVTLNSFNVLNHQNDVTFVGVFLRRSLVAPLPHCPRGACKSIWNTNSEYGNSHSAGFFPSCSVVDLKRPSHWIVNLINGINA